MIDLAGDTLMAGVPIINAGNIQNYINQGHVVPPYSDSSHTYSKLCSVAISGNDTNAVLRFVLVNTDWTDYNTQFADVLIKVGIRGNVSTGVKQCHVNCIASKTINPSNIVAVVTKNDSTGYAIEVYFNQQNASGGARKYLLIPTLSYTNIKANCLIQYTDSLASLSALPTETQIICDGGSRDLMTVHVFYDGANWQIQDMLYNNLGNIVNSETAQYMYGIPSWSTDGVIFPSTSIFMASTTNFTSIASGYINGSTLAYEPVIVPYLAGNTRKIRFFNRSTGAMVTTPDTSMNFMLTISTLR